MSLEARATEMQANDMLEIGGSGAKEAVTKENLRDTILVDCALGQSLGLKNEKQPIVLDSRDRQIDDEMSM